MSNPYKGLNDYCFWSRSMTIPALAEVDPVVRSEIINSQDKVATLGSCFAQHLARHIQQSGLNYFVAEKAPVGMAQEKARELNYGVFSARYGNIYTVKQAVQLFERAFGRFHPSDDVWERDGKYVDAFRPLIEPEGWTSEIEVRSAAIEHLGYVREVFSTSDWFVFTLGLTEAWRSKVDGAIYPVAPGVSGGKFDNERYEFVNFSANEVADDLVNFLNLLRSVNSKVRILLTVSPVPLIATYENRHVWVSTTFSKAALRVAADIAERKFENVIYFPSYEIITSPGAGNRFYADDLREVTEVGVKQVMRLFSKHFFMINSNTPIKASNEAMPNSTKFSTNSDIVCDEAVIEKALRVSGF